MVEVIEVNNMLEITKFENGVATVKESTYRKYYIDFDEGTVTPLPFDDGDYEWTVDPDLY